MELCHDFEMRINIFDSLLLSAVHTNLAGASRWVLDDILASSFKTKNRLKHYVPVDNDSFNKQLLNH